MKTLQSQVLQYQIGIGVNLKELLLHLLLDNGRLDILHQELTSRNGRLNLVNPEGIVNPIKSLNLAWAVFPSSKRACCSSVYFS